MGAEKVAKTSKGLCLFDWNGTLQDDLHHIYECGVQRIFQQFGLPCPSMEQYRFQVTHDFMSSFYWKHGIPKHVTAADLNAIMSEGFKAKGTPAELFPDAEDTVRTLHGRGYQLMLVSGYDSKKLADAVHLSGLRPCFSHIVGDVRDKPASFRDCIARARDFARLVKIGDTVEDMIAAHSVGATPYICPRGFHPYARIEAARTQAPSLVIIDTLAALKDILL